MVLLAIQSLLVSGGTNQIITVLHDWLFYNPSFNLNIGECSRKRFSEKQAEQWWAENRARVYEQYNVRMIDKSSVGIGGEDMAH